MKKIYLAVLLWAIMFTCKAQYTWTQKDSFPGAPRRFATSFATGGSGYLVAGSTSKSPFVTTNDVWQYNASSDSWTQKRNFPQSLSGLTSFVLNGTPYTVGGEDQNGNYYSNVYSYNPSTDNWSSQTPFPSTVAEAFSFVLGNTGYVGCGTGGGANSFALYSYSPTSNSWSQLAPYPGQQSFNMAGFAIDSFGYAGLGQDGQGNFFSNFYKYNPATNAWSQIATYPGRARASATVFVLDGKAFVGGGVALLGGNGYALGDFYMYEPSTNTWSAVPGYIGPPREVASSFVINDVAYSICGEDDNGVVFFNYVAAFSTCQTLTSITPIPGANSGVGIELYPNPTNSDVTVKLSDEVTSEINYKIVSMDGRMLKTGLSRQNTFNFNAGNFADGIYIISISDSQGNSSSQRFEVIH